MEVAAGDVYRFSLVQKAFDNEIVNTFATRIETLTLPTEEDVFLASQWNATDGRYTVNLSQTLAEMQHTSVTHVRWDVQRVYPTVGALYAIPLTQDGQLEGDLPTLNVALCISRHGAGGGRRQRGRIAIGGLPDAAYNNVMITSTFNTFAAAFKAHLYETFTAALGAYSISTGFWSPEKTVLVDGEPVVLDAQYVKCVSAINRATARVQRSRTIDVGS